MVGDPPWPRGTGSHAVKVLARVNLLDRARPPLIFFSFPALSQCGFRLNSLTRLDRPLLTCLLIVVNPVGAAVSSVTNIISCDLSSVG